MSSEQLQEAMRRMDALLSHIWMVRTFLKHSEEVQDDDDLATVHRDLYDFMLALGPSAAAGDAREYFRLATRKAGRLRRAVETFSRIQPQVSEHMNFKMAARSLDIAWQEIRRLMEGLARETAVPSDPGAEED
ncbi:MAG: amidohydrolase [Planctomycetes bacterium]|nr:amidohydrolase [Planctomycetota bacterium]